MSWNPFSRLGSGRSSGSRTDEEKEFEKEVKKLEKLHEITKQLQQDAERLVEANVELSKTEHHLTQQLLDTELCGKPNHDLKWLTEEWDKALRSLDRHNQDVNGVLQKAIIDPIKKFNSIFPNVQAAKKRREQALQDLQKCEGKVSKYTVREKTGSNIVKLTASKKASVQAQNEFGSQNAALMEDMPKLYESRIPYLQPYLEALIKSQVQYTTEAYKVYSGLSNTMNGQQDLSNQDYGASIQDVLGQIKALSITDD